MQINSGAWTPEFICIERKRAKLSPFPSKKTAKNFSNSCNETGLFRINRAER